MWLNDRRTARAISRTSRSNVRLIISSGRHAAGWRRQDIMHTTDTSVINAIACVCYSKLNTQSAFEPVS